MSEVERLLEKDAATAAIDQKRRQLTRRCVRTPFARCPSPQAFACCTPGLEGETGSAAAQDVARRFTVSSPLHPPLLLDPLPTYRFIVATAALLIACGVMIACHKQLAAVKLYNGAETDVLTDKDLGEESDTPVDARAVKFQQAQARDIDGQPTDVDATAERQAALVSLDDPVADPSAEMGQPEWQYPTWWNDQQSLPDASPIFIHIPKTGGVSVEDLASKAGHALGACVVSAFGDGALPYPQAKGYIMEPYHTPPARFVPFSFTVVRNPYARAVSEFNWVSMYDPAKAADIEAGKWSFTCEDFQNFIESRVGGLSTAPLYRCLQEEGFAEEGYNACAAKDVGHIDASHILPQWLFAKNAERVFKYEDFDRLVWPFLRNAGVIGENARAEKINSAGSASETASKCWPFVSQEVLAKFVEFYAMDFKNLGYSTTEFRRDAATAALGSSPGQVVHHGIDHHPSDMSEALKAKLRSATKLHVDINADHFFTSEQTGNLGLDNGQPSGFTPDEEHVMRATPVCVTSDKVKPLGTVDENGAVWTPQLWAVVEGVLRRAIVRSQVLAREMTSSVRDVGMPAVTAALKSTVEVRNLGEAAGRNPLGTGADEQITAAANAAVEAEQKVAAAAAALEQEGFLYPQTIKDQFKGYVSEAAQVRETFAQALHMRRVRDAVMSARANPQEAAALAGIGPR